MGKTVRFLNSHLQKALEWVGFLENVDCSMIIVIPFIRPWGTMTDFHHNIFYYYKGAHQSHQEAEQQLENNTTKSLVNTLEHCSDPVKVKFLDLTGITAVGEQIKFKLQKKTISEQEIRGKS